MLLADTCGELDPAEERPCLWKTLVSPPRNTACAAGLGTSMGTG